MTFEGPFQTKLFGDSENLVTGLIPSMRNLLGNHAYLQEFKQRLTNSFFFPREACF